MYATVEEYTAAGGVIPAASVVKFLESASDKIDGLTFHRINAAGFENLTVFQKTAIKKACCQIADYLHENGENPQSVESYSILDISVSVGAKTEAERNGIPSTAWDLLKATGLTRYGF